MLGTLQSPGPLDRLGEHSTAETGVLDRHPDHTAQSNGIGLDILKNLQSHGALHQHSEHATEHKVMDIHREHAAAEYNCIEQKGTGETF